MRTTIDAAGRMVVPKAIRDELGFTAGAELDARVVDGRLEVALPTRVRVERGPHGVRFATDTDERLSAADVRDLIERSRR
jgi:AbrB family looped-hinge helix DNA binding protein